MRRHEYVPASVFYEDGKEEKFCGHGDVEDPKRMCALHVEDPVHDLVNIDTTGTHEFKSFGSGECTHWVIRDRKSVRCLLSEIDAIHDSNTLLR